MKALIFIAILPLCFVLTVIALVASPVIETEPDHG